MKRTWIYILVSTIAIFLLWTSLQNLNHSNRSDLHPKNDSIPELWYAPKDKDLPSGESGELIRYGRELIVHTSVYFGPKGSISALSNGLNCQNCHLDAGTRAWGNNYSAVLPTYPKLRQRSGKVESISKRVNDCFERSLNGTAIDTLGKEMNAIVAYISWLGQGIPKGEKPHGSGITKLAFLDRAADPVKGKTVYTEKCQSCHMANGEGVMNAEGTEYQYPPLWGEHSYNQGAGLYRLSRLAGYVKSNMPFGSSYAFPLISDEDAWDVAAFVNSQERPAKDLSSDWPDISKKPTDHPFGPFADGFSEQQHKYGPFQAIEDWKTAHK
jgi:thiosulfate dehydrogenase